MKTDRAFEAWKAVDWDSDPIEAMNMFCRVLAEDNPEPELKWKPGLTVERSDGRRVVLRHKVDLDHWACKSDFGDCTITQSPAWRVAAPPDTSTASTSSATTDERDYSTEIEAGDTVSLAGKHGWGAVLGIDGDFIWHGLGDISHRDACYLFSKRPDKPGDGFEIIGQESQGVHRWGGEKYEAAEYIFSSWLWPVPRSHLRRVYAVR